MKKVILFTVLTVGFLTTTFAQQKQDSVLKVIVVFDTADFNKMARFFGDAPTSAGVEGYYNMLKNSKLIKVPNSPVADKPKKSK